MSISNRKVAAYGAIASLREVTRLTPQAGTVTDSRLCSVIFTDPTMEAPYTKVGRIEHFYSKASVAIVELSSPLKQGDKITIRGSTTKVDQTVDSMEVEHKQVPIAQAGQRVGLKVAGRVRENDVVYKVE